MSLLTIPVQMPPAALVGLSLLTAGGYAVATVGLKLASDGAYAIAAALIVTGFTLATFAEIALLRHYAVSVIYILIIALETLIIMGFALWLGETPSMTQMAGAVLVVAGLAITAT